MSLMMTLMRLEIIPRIGVNFGLFLTFYKDVKRYSELHGPSNEIHIA